MFHKVVATDFINADPVDKPLTVGLTVDLVDKALAAGFTPELFDKALAVGLTVDMFDKALAAGLTAEMFDKALADGFFNAELFDKALTPGFELFDKVLHKDRMLGKECSCFVSAIRRCRPVVGIVAASAAVNGVVGGANTPASVLGHLVLLLCGLSLATIRLFRAYR